MDLITRVFYGTMTFNDLGFLHLLSQVRKSLAQVVTAMAPNGYLNLEGGDQLVEFLVRQCAVDEATVSITVPPASFYRFKAFFTV